jgi:hypothetical protein
LPLCSSSFASPTSEQQGTASRQATSSPINTQAASIKRQCGITAPAGTRNGYEATIGLAPPYEAAIYFAAATSVTVFIVRQARSRAILRPVLTPPLAAVSLFGVAVMSGVLYVAEMRRQQAGGHADVREAAVAAAGVQFRPMLLLIVVALLGMMPAARASGIGSDIQRPLATMVVGGLVSTLLLTLLALPAVYVLVERVRPSRRSA